MPARIVWASVALVLFSCIIIGFIVRRFEQKSGGKNENADNGDSYTVDVATRESNVPAGHRTFFVLSNRQAATVCPGLMALPGVALPPEPAGVPVRPALRCRAEVCAVQSHNEDVTGGQMSRRIGNLIFTSHLDDD